MSFPENDRKLQSKIRKTFPAGDGYVGQHFAEAIAEALKVDFGASPSSVKQIARLTRANERAVRNWLEAKNGPSGENLVGLMRHSEAVFATVLQLCGRDGQGESTALNGLRQHLVAAIAAIDALGAPAI
jgi:hypothetical protein